MEQTLQALGGILLKAIPSAILLVILHLYLKAVLFSPVERMLKQRDELTEGARRAAERSLTLAEQKAQEYEGKLRDARAVVYKEQEETRRRWLEEQATQLVRAREATEAQVNSAKQAIASEIAQARQSLEASSGALADQIAGALLGRRAG
jgi:F-type H+-transporting ATPase subunit b